MSVQTPFMILSSSRFGWSLSLRRALAAIASVVALGAAMLAAPVAPARAQKAAEADAGRLAAAKELMRVAGAAKQFDAVMPMVFEQMQGLILRQHSQHEKVLKEIFAAVLETFKSRKGELIDEIATLYAERLTAGELEQLTAFYASGVGAKFVAMQADIGTRAMALGQRWGARIGREVEAEVRRLARERGIDL